MDVKKILMPTDFSACANAALGHALFLAEHLDADLDILHVVVLHNADPLEPTSQFPDADSIYRSLQEIASSELHGLLKDHRTDHLDIREVQRRAVAAAPAIVEYVEEEGIDLVVLGAHGRRGFRRFLMGSVAEEVVRLAPCPVMTLRGTGPTPKLERWEKIVVPFDFSEEAKTALETAKELAARYGSKVHVVHVVEPIMEPHPYVPLHYRNEEFDLPRLLEHVRQDLESLVKTCGDASIACKVAVLEGSPGLRVAEYAEEIAAELIVLTTHGRTGLKRFFLGSVAEKVVRSSNIPVLTLKVT